jgi:hypothetical protein
VEQGQQTLDEYYTRDYAADFATVLENRYVYIQTLLDDILEDDDDDDDDDDDAPNARLSPEKSENSEA